ncbi:MAG: 50S ribosomal protein L9 [Clostridium sp.]|jgi:large subunit ribosomal protein L9|nr:50S ribosomal protein L9 [Clostridium sp.]CDA37693.1 50S ribosomal protein L9 [Clostridium sp. CAG:568]
MKLIMKKDLKGVGKAGQVVEVSDGYGANFIIPRGFGVLYTPESVKEREEELARLKAIDDANRAKANENAKKLEGIVFEFVAPVGNGGRMIGTVSIKELKKALKEKLEIDVDKDDFPEHNIVNSFGMSHVKINLYKGIYGIMNVKVNPKPSK